MTLLAKAETTPARRPRVIGAALAALKEVLAFCGPIALVLVIWEVAARLGFVNPVLLPPPSAVARNMIRLLEPAEGGGSSVLITNTVVSFLRILAGYGLAAVLCTGLGLLMGINKRIYAFFNPIITVIMPIPSLAWVPIVILWLGMTDATIVLVVFLASIFPIIYNSAAGVRSITKKHLWAAELMGASRTRIFLRVLLPGAMPYVITGHILAVSRAWRALIGAEMLAGAGLGLGYMIFDARTFMDTETVYSGIAMIALLGLLIEKGLFRPLQRMTVERWGMVRVQ